ncbi:MAG: hydantoinase B/oxoprolinase family protein [Rhodospirillaceae bacterium]|nr:hydantoinase B/oxoprolinase family protein [Rhodospirillaceae bacterium]
MTTPEQLTPMLLDIVEGAVESSMKEIEAQVERTARSTNIREANDHVPAIYDARGRSIASVSFTANVDPILKRWPAEAVKPGDVFLWNHPYQSDGGIGHLPDLCFTIPVIVDGELVAFVQELGHVQDIGGSVPGSLSQTAKDIFSEGLIVPPVKYYDAGVRNAAVFEILKANTRFPDDLEGDVDAMISGARLGVERIEWLCRQYGTALVREAFDTLIDRCEKTLKRDVLPRIPDGTYAYEDYVEYVDVVPQEPRKFIRIALSMRKTAEKIEFDFTGTDAQVIGSINFPADERFYARALVTTFKSFFRDRFVINDGVLKVVSVKVPEGTVLNPKFPAACSYRHYPLIRCFSVVLGVLARAMSGQVPQGADNMSGVSMSGIHPDTREPWYLSMPLGGGSCGRPFADGSDTVLMTPGKNVPSEYGEQFYPFTILDFGLNPDSGGPGASRGGLGYRIVMRFDAPAVVRVRTDRYYIEPAGVNGGKAGKAAEFVFNPGQPNQRILPGKTDDGWAEPGDILLITSPGGGGWGDPLDRAAEDVERDVKNGMVGLASARDDYGVVPGDATATAALRAKIRAARAPLPMFDRGPKFRALQKQGLVSLAVPDNQPPASPTHASARQAAQ